MKNRSQRNLWWWLAVMLACGLLALFVASCGDDSDDLCAKYCDKLDECGVDGGEDCEGDCKLLSSTEGDTYYKCVVDKSCSQISTCGVAK